LTKFSQKLKKQFNNTTIEQFHLLKSVFGSLRIRVHIYNYCFQHIFITFA